MQRTKILCVAPYEGMKTLVTQIAAKRTDIELLVVVGDLDTGAGIAKGYSEADLDAIISRGGTAELIRREVPLPVIEIPLTVYDILRSIKLAENYNDKYAIIGFSAITKNAHFLCEILRYDIDIYTIQNEKDARETLNSLRKNGYGMVLCDMITNSLAQSYGIRSILITSGTESVESALDQAVQTSRIYKRLKGRVSFFKTIIEEQQKHVFVYSADAESLYASNKAAVPPQIAEKLINSIPLVIKEQKKRICCEFSGGLYTISAVSKEIDGRQAVIYYVHIKKAPMPMAKSGISYLSKEDAFNEFFNSFYGVTQLASPPDMTIDQYAQSKHPLVILGEIGTGKDEMTHLVYAKSRLCGNPLVTVDCSRLHNKGWDFLIENDASPLNDTDITIHIKNSKFLSDGQFFGLCAAIKDLDCHRRNRLIFTQSDNADNKSAERCRYLVNDFSCLTLYLSPLCDHKNDISSLASLYINILNMQMAKEIIGFDPEALSALEAYNWPNNYSQFKRVIEELVTVSDSPYISFEAVSGLLKREAKLMYTAGTPSNCTLDLNRTLEEINLDILARVMSEEKGNQSAAAKRLGISRTTLWRMLQKITSANIGNAN